MVWMEDKTNDNIPLSQSLTQSHIRMLLSSRKAERGEKAAEEKFEALVHEVSGKKSFP